MNRSLKITIKIISKYVMVHKPKTDGLSNRCNSAKYLGIIHIGEPRIGCAPVQPFKCNYYSNFDFH